MKHVFYILAAAALLASCSAIETDIATAPAEDENLVTVTVGVKMSEETKVVLYDDGVSKFLKWKNGDVISIGLRNKSTSATSQINTTVNVEGDDASVTFAYDPEVYEITDARYPQGGINATIPTRQYMWRGDIIIPLTAAYDGSQSSITFAPTVGDDYTVLQYRLKEGNTSKTLESIEVSFNGGETYTLDTKTKMGAGGTDAGITLNDTAKDFFIVIPSGTDSHELNAVFKMSDGTQYTRTKKTFTPTARKLHIMPVISDLDDTGKHMWYFNNSSDNASEVPLQYWFRSNGTKSLNAITYHDTYATMQTVSQSGSTKFRADLAVIISTNYSSDGVNFTTARYNGDIPMVKVHSGNYPIFAIKMTNPKSMGTTSRNFNLDTAGMKQDKSSNGYSGNVGGTNNKQKYLVDESVAVLYYDLSTQGFNTGGILPNTSMFEFQTWQFKFADITYATDQDSAPTYDIYWAGFFNSVSELTTFAASH